MPDSLMYVRSRKACLELGGIRFLTEFCLPTYFACMTSKIGLYDKHS